MPNRIWFASKRAGIAPLGSRSAITLRGLQSIGITTTFNLEQVFELGQATIYENIEGIPDVSVDIEKVLDGYTPAYLLATQLAGSPTLIGRACTRSTLAVSVYSESCDGTSDGATGMPNAEVHMSGLYVGSISYAATVDGNATESLTLVGNDKVWVGLVTNASSAPRGHTSMNYVDDPFKDNDDIPIAMGGSGGVQRREDVLFVYPGNKGHRNAPKPVNNLDVNGAVSGDGTILPIELPGISASGTNDKSSTTNQFGAHIQNITISTDLGREDIFELGRKGNYYKYANFPVEVTTEIGMISVSGDLISAAEEGITTGTGACPAGNNLTNSTIRLHMCEGLQVNCGTKNKLASVGVTGGDTGGGNEEITYTYSNFNVMTVYHPNDPNRGLMIDAEGWDTLFDPKGGAAGARV